VVEADQPNDPTLERATRAVGKDRVLVVLPSADMVETSSYKWTLERPADPNAWQDFSTSLVKKLLQQWEDLLDTQQTISKIRGLLNQGQYQMAFLSGVVELEGRLNRILRTSEIDATLDEIKNRRFKSRPASLRDLLEIARIRGPIDISPEELLELVYGRNKVTHGGAASASELKELTELVLRLLEQIPEDS
jgi:hypothetical protein